MDAAVDTKPGGEGITWHAVAADEVVKRLKTNPQKGLDAGDAAQRLQKYGPNRLPEGKKRGPFMRFLRSSTTSSSTSCSAPGSSS